MKTISLTVVESDYEIFREAAKTRGRSIAQLIREAMELYRAERLEAKPRLEDLPVVVGPRAAGSLPVRSEIYDEIFSRAGE